MNLLQNILLQAHKLIIKTRLFSSSRKNILLENNASLLSFSHVQAIRTDEEGTHKERFNNDNDHYIAESPALGSTRRSRYRLHHRALQPRFREDAR